MCYDAKCLNIVDDCRYTFKAQNWSFLNSNRFRESIRKWQYDIVSSGVGSIQSEQHNVFFHDFSNFVVVVENNTTTTATTIQRILSSPIIYLWLLLIVLFVVLRCGLQWLNEREGANSATQRQRCIFMCQDTVQLSCGVVMDAKQFDSHRFRQGLLAHGTTIIPLVAGMFLSGLLYGEYLIHSEVPNIDSMDQLNQSDLAVCGPFTVRNAFKGFWKCYNMTFDANFCLFQNWFQKWVCAKTISRNFRNDLAW